MPKKATPRGRIQNREFLCVYCYKLYNEGGNGRIDAKKHMRECSMLMAPVVPKPVSKVYVNIDTRLKSPDTIMHDHGKLQSTPQADSTGIVDMQLNDKVQHHDTPPQANGSTTEDIKLEESDSAGYDMVSLGNYGNAAQPPMLSWQPEQQQQQDAVVKDSLDPGIEFSNRSDIEKDDRALEYSMKLFKVAKQHGLSRDGYDEMVKIFNEYIETTAGGSQQPLKLMSHF